MQVLGRRVSEEDQLASIEDSAESARREGPPEVVIVVVVVRKHGSQRNSSWFRNMSWLQLREAPQELGRTATCSRRSQDRQARSRKMCDGRLGNADRREDVYKTMAKATMRCGKTSLATAQRCADSDHSGDFGKHLKLLAAETQFGHDDVDSPAAFKGHELQDEEAEAVTVQTESLDFQITEKCFLEEPLDADAITAVVLLPPVLVNVSTCGKGLLVNVYEGVMLMTVLSRRLLWEVADNFPSLAHLNSDKSFITTLLEGSRESGESRDETGAQSQPSPSGLHDGAAAESRVKGAPRFAEGEQSGIQTALALSPSWQPVAWSQLPPVEEGGGMVGDPHHLWHMWQEAMGAVRVIVKVTTQCRIEVPPEYDSKSFMTRQHQDQWKVCKDAIPYMEDEFPSAVMACARSDEAHQKYGGQDRNRVVRYMGCGKSRVKVEPPVSRVVTEGCLSVGDEDEPELTDFLNQMCSAQGISDRSCRLYGPFYGVYSHLAEDLFGYHSLKEKEECLAIAATNLENAAAEEEQEAEEEAAPTPKRGKGGRGSLLEDEQEQEDRLQTDEPEECADPQAKAFIGQANRAMAEYIYGLTPPLSYSRSRAWNKKETKLKET
ncbi:unnamed protein product, partial [Symbiodinium necroappetens]